ncbi:MAG: substrate-binding domain-containing protein [Acidobacteria bacterium]|nr:substrate-binding domain-containing protein [Acidobacteriota bacterium]
MPRFAFLLCLSVCVAACGGTPSSESGAPKTLRFAVIPKALDIPVFNYARIGAERKAKELGNIEVLWRGPESADQLRQREVLESFISQRVDGIAISCTNGDFLAPIIDKAIAAGIPVITWDADAPTSKRIAYYGVDDFKAGQRLATEAVAALGGKGRVALMTSLGAYNLQRRLDGVNDILEQHPGITIVETFDVKEDIVRAGEVIATATNRYPDLDAWITVGGWPVMTRNALAPVDTARTRVFSFDTIPPAPELLKAGKVHTLVGQKYFGWGSEAVRILAEIKAGRMPQQAIIDSGIDVVNRANVDEYLVEWHRLEQGQ